MDIRNFFKLLKRYKWIVIIFPIICAITTYFLVKDLPKIYNSKAQISTGLIDQSQQISAGTNNQDYFKVSSQFSNIMEIMKMDKTISTLSYSLILHDLQNPKSSFAKYSEEIKALSESQKQKLIEEYKKMLINRVVMTPALNGEFKFYDILKSMGYDEKSLNANLSIYHVDNSDFITIEYTSHNADLSAYTVNTLATEFINTYSLDVSNNLSKSNLLLDSLLKQKEVLMNEKNAALKNYKINNGVLNLDKQSENIYTQITDYEQKKSDVLREIQANRGAITAIDKRLNSKNSVYSGGGVIAGNNRIVNIKNLLKIANDRYVDNNFRPADKMKIDSLQSLLSEEISNTSDRYVADPTANKQSLITQKMNLEIALDLAKNSIRSIDGVLAQLKSKYNSMVPFDAGIQNFERDADVATKEYLDVLNKSNENSLEKNIGLKLRLAQAGFPGTSEPSKAILFTALAGIASFMVCFITILIFFLLDRSINTTVQLQSFTKSKVLGKLNLIKSNNKEIRDLWKDNNSNQEYTIYKDLLRSLRFEIDQMLSVDDSKILGITSLYCGEGKTFLASSLVYAFAMTGKKVLLISGEKEQNEVVPDQKLIPEQFFETFLVKKEIQVEDLITVLNNKSNKTSLFEMQDKNSLKSGFSILKGQFDIILVDITSLQLINRAKEWLLFTEKNIAIFEAGRTVDEKSLENLDYIKNHKGFIGWILNKAVEI